MNKTVTKFFLVIITIFGLIQATAAEVYPFVLKSPEGTVLEGYYSPPSTIGSPIIFAVQGSSCESILQWHISLSDHASALGLGVITLEKQGISREGIDLLTYNETNCLQNRLENYVDCFEHAHLICPGWEGKPIFWGESEGGMLAAALAGQTPQTAAVLLFGTGGGMKPREEVKWSLQHRLEKQGARQEEIDEYMNFLEEQMDAMIFDPTPEKQFLGNTYKWWSSFLCADEAALPLKQQSLPICLVHGVEDGQIPILSADLAAESLAKTNALTYLRLEGYGHDLDTAEVRDAACHWLSAVLFGEELSDGIFITRAASTASVSFEDSQDDLSDYVFSRGKDKGGENGEQGGQLSGTLGGSKDSKGNQTMTAETKVIYDFGNGTRFEGSAGVSGGTDSKGNTTGEVHGTAGFSTDF